MALCSIPLMPNETAKFLDLILMGSGVGALGEPGGTRKMQT